MSNPFQTTFGAVFKAEVLINMKRIAPYVLMILFAANALLWWGWGPAVSLGWATNSDFYIVRNYFGFSFLLGLPIFNAVIMADPVIRDYRLGVDPLIFSKPLNRAEYLLGKFFGNFFVLVCCQSAFALTLLVLQAFRTSEMVVLPVRVVPYLKHFLFIVVITHLVLAAFYFTVGTLTRNAKIVYVLGVCFYPLYIMYKLLFLRRLPPVLETLLDPLFHIPGLEGGGFLHSAEFLNQFVVVYSIDMLVNRLLVILVTAVCLAILYKRFTTSERSKNVVKMTSLNLSTATERIYYDSYSLPLDRSELVEKVDSPDLYAIRFTPLPEATRMHEGMRANVSKLFAALSVEFRLLRAERSLVVLLPMAIFLSTFELAFYEVVPGISYSATYASSTANTLLLFLLGMTVFYTGEAMSRDRELKVEPILWSSPASNNILLISKFLATLSLTLTLTVTVGLTAIVIQFLRGHTPIEIPAFLLTYLVILFPSLVFLAAVSVALNVLLRDKYFAYAVSIGTGAALFYLYSQGYNHWLYNPLLYQLWSYADLTGNGSNQATILIHRLYCLAIACAYLSLAHLFFERKSTRGVKADSHLSSRGWSLVVLIVSVAMATITGLIIRSI